MKTLALIFLTLALAVPVTWHFAHPSAATATSTGRKVLFYQSAMHPWVKSDKPGRCTICGMELTPVYDGEKSFVADGEIVSLSESAARVLHVQTAEATKRPLAKTLVFGGTVDDDARQHRIISATVDGRIEKLFVNYSGAEISEGKPLYEIYSPTLLRSEREYALVSAESRPTLAQRLRQLGLSAEQINALQRKPPESLTSEIVSPISGIVVSDDIYSGQSVTAGQKLFEIADFSTMWFVFPVYEQDLPWLKVGQPIEVATPSVPDRKFTGSISFIDPNFDELTRTTKVRVELLNPLVDGKRALMHRLTGEAVVQLDAPEVLTVPRPAIIQTGAEAVAYVEQPGGNYERRIVKLGRRGDTLVEILDGIKAGEKVVTNGNLLLDGQAEMNRSFSAPPPLPHSPPVAAFVRVADALAAALAKDDFAAFQTAAKEAHAATKTLADTFPAFTSSLKTADQLHTAHDLAAARKLFHAFSVASLAKLPADKSFDIFECPMVDQIIPGVPPKGRWLQASGTTIRNPYFGSEMLECGVKIQP